MTSKEAISDIILLTREYNCTSLNLLREQISKAVAQNKYNWQVARIEETGKIILE
ncbi:MAG: hypothetical protein ABR909_13705 [Candidatus Bathyarchaeia archaeon]|jgi:hypothetical protein